ncbi:MAG: hypothetical protein ACYS6K_20060 [Planctomycetota bacterium]|jgi:hypothetical protein
MESSITHHIDQEYIREWLVLGAFFPNDLKADFLTQTGGEMNVRPQEGDTVTTDDGRRLTWKRYKTEGDVIDLMDAVENHKNATVYAFSVIPSEVECDAEVYFGSIGGAVVWMNGKQVYRFDGRRTFTFDEDVFEVKLTAGVNYCLIKVGDYLKPGANWSRMPGRQMPHSPESRCAGEIRLNGIIFVSAGIEAKVS